MNSLSRDVLEKSGIFRKMKVFLRFTVSAQSMWGENESMNCPYCMSSTIKNLSKKTSLGYQIFRCLNCGRIFNERTGTAFNNLEYPTDVVLLVIRWRLQYKLSLRDLAEVFSKRGFTFTYEAIRDWEARFAPIVTEQLQSKQPRRTQESWLVHETYIKISGKNYYMYRATDRYKELLDTILNDRRDMPAAKRFFSHAGVVVGGRPGRLKNNGHDF